MILAATNRPESLDQALLRPGRFDRRVPVELPDLKGRESHPAGCTPKRCKMDDPDATFNVVARATPGASGAELANIINEAALCAVRPATARPSPSTTCRRAVDTVLAGYAEEEHRCLSDKEKCIVAYHEIGHALVAALQSHSVRRYTRSPSCPAPSGALGYTMQVEDGDHTLMTKEEDIE